MKKLLQLKEKFTRLTTIEARNKPVRKYLAENNIELRLDLRTKKSWQLLVDTISQTSSSSYEDLNKLTVKELKDICRDNDIKRYRGLSKAELICLINKPKFVFSILEEYSLEELRIEASEYFHPRSSAFKMDREIAIRCIKRNHEVGIAYIDDEFYRVYKDGSKELISIYDIRCDGVCDYYTEEYLDIKGMIRSLEEDEAYDREVLALTRGGVLPHVESLEQLLLLPPAEFRELCEKLEVVQGNNEKIGEFYLTVWEAYNGDKLVSERQLNAAWKQRIEASKGEYNVYHKYLQSGAFDDFDTVMPYTDYSYYNQYEKELVLPTRTYDEWLQVQKLNKTFELEITYEEEEMLF